MKKLLAILGTIGFVVTPAASVVTSCSKELVVPTFDIDGGFDQFSDNWNFTNAKTVSLFTPSSNEDSSTLIEGEVSLRKIMEDQVKILLAGRFADGVDWNKDVFNKSTIKFYESNDDSSEIKEDNDKLFTNIEKNLKLDLNNTKKIYFKISKEKSESDFMNLTLTCKPLITQMSDFIGTLNENEMSGTYFAWNKQNDELKYGTDEEKKDAKSVLVSEFTQFNQITVNGKGYPMKDFFIGVYSDETISGKFSIINLSSWIKTGISDEIANKLINTDDPQSLFGITIKSFIPAK